MFKKRENVAAIEEGKLLSPKFDKDGLIPVITTDCNTGEVLMHGYMNSEALKKQLRIKKLFIGVDQEKKFGTKVRLVASLKKLLNLELMMIKTLYG